jgi:uncharacterized protein YggE
MERISSSRCVSLPDRPAPCVNVTDTSYRARENIELRIHDIHLVRSVIDSALAMGIMEIPSVRFAATRVAEWEDEALREATQRARERAEILARESGGRLGSMIWLRIERETGPVTIEVVVTVSGIWRFEPGPR